MPFKPASDEVILYSVDKGAWLYFRKPVQIYTAWSVDEVLVRLNEVERAVDERGLYAAGLIAYEAAPAFDSANRVCPSSDSNFPLLWFGIYEEAEHLSALERPIEKVTRPVGWKAEITQANYRRAIHRIKRAIAHGETYQVNYTYRMRIAWNEDPWPVFANLANTSPAPYSSFLETEDWAICSFSPELFFSLDGDRILSRPMKGTAQRGLQLEDDLHQSNWLRRSPKNRAENVMIVDMVRNDLGRIAQVGSVKTSVLFEIEKYPTVWQMTSTVQARTDASLSEIFLALFPAASITGAPKIHTMQIITALETSPRRIYTGTIGYYGPGRKARFNVAIRTLLVEKHKHQAEYGVGGGVVWDSRPKLEWEESRIKAQVLFEPRQAFELVETMLWTDAEGWRLLPEHLARLERSAAYFSYPLDLGTLRQKLVELARSFSGQAERVRLLLDSRGGIDLSHRPLAADPNPQRVHLAKTCVNSTDRFLYHKTTMRAVYERAREETAGYDEALLFNERSELTEACIANLVVELDGGLFTPPASCGLLPGTYRKWLLRNGKIRERVIYPADLRLCSRICLANSLRGMWEIQVIGLDLREKTLS